MDQESITGLECRKQENSSQLSKLLEEERITHESPDHKSLKSRGSGSTCPIWRERVSKWYYDVVDHLGEARSSVFVAMNILDRYLVVKNITNTSDRNYEVASLTALFLSLRIRGSESLEVVDLIRMSRLGVTIREIVEVGKDMTHSLSFERRLLTPTDFVLHMVQFMPRNRQDEIRNISLLNAELSVFDGALAGTKPSEIAIAAILNALGSDESCLFWKVMNLSHVNYYSCNLQDLRMKLRNLKHNCTRANEPHLIPDSDDESENILPVLSRPLFVATKKMRGLKRSMNCTMLSSIDTSNSSTTPSKDTQLSDSRPVSPTPEESNKFQYSG